MGKLFQISFAVLSLYLAGIAAAASTGPIDRLTERRERTVRAVDMSTTQWSQLGGGEAADLIVEFRQGDEIPVSMSSKGDLLETVHVGTSYVVVKRNFWVKVGEGNQILMSLDGLKYRRLQDSVSGTLSAGASAPHPGDPANAINVLFESKLK